MWDAIISLRVTSQPFKLCLFTAHLFSKLHLPAKHNWENKLVVYGCHFSETDSIKSESEYLYRHQT